MTGRTRYRAAAGCARDGGRWSRIEHARAFDLWLGRDRPAFVPRSGSSPETVIATIHQAEGLASLAHPGRTAIDARIPALRDAGLDAIEVYHSDHDAATSRPVSAVGGRTGTADDRGVRLPRRSGARHAHRIVHASARGVAASARGAASTCRRVRSSSGFARSSRITKA